MKAIIEYQDGKTEERYEVDWFNDSGNRITLHYINDEESGFLEIPKRAIKKIKITDFTN